MIKTKTYKLPQSSLITKNILSLYINSFWDDIFKALHIKNNNIHLLLICKVHFIDTTDGYRTLGNMRKVNFTDKIAFLDFLLARLAYLSDSYKVNFISTIEFSYIVREGLADDSRQLLNETVYEVATHSFNDMQLPLTMYPNKYGNIIAIQNFMQAEGSSDNFCRYVVVNKYNTIVIDVYNDHNNVHIQAPVDLKWTDTKLSETTFKRDINQSTLYVKNGVVIIKEKQLPAKPFKTLKTESNITPLGTIMTIDIETVSIDGKLQPYLICGYTKSSIRDRQGSYIHSYATDISPDAQKEMFTNFITQLLQFKKVKYIYSHNLSGFDGILLMKHLLNYKGATVDPLLFNGKLISIKFKVLVDNKLKIIVFKDSYLLLPMSLRQLCNSFKVINIKSYFPFLLTDINYVGSFPDFELWTDLHIEDYQRLKLHNKNFEGGIWSFMKESINYCNVDCKCLFDVLVNFNELVFIEFKVNIHSALTLPALAMKIYKSQFMPKNTLYKILGDVEKDIRESYTGGAVDVYLPPPIRGGSSPRLLI